MIRISEQSPTSKVTKVIKSRSGEQSKESLDNICLFQWAYHTKETIVFDAAWLIVKLTARRFSANCCKTDIAQKLVVTVQHQQLSLVGF